MSKLKAKAPELTKPGKIKGLLFGASGAGKTWFSLTFPKPYYIDTEGGADLKHYQKRLADSGGVYMGQEDGSLVFSEVLDQVKALATEKHDYHTLIIDSITKLYQVCIADEAEKLGEKDAFGASKKPAIANMRRLVAWIQKLDMNVWFIAHEMTEWGLDAKGNRAELGKIADVWDKLIYELDLTVRVIKQGPDRIGIVTKSRLEGFPDAARFTLSYPEFAGHYSKDAIEAPVVPLSLATKEQVAEVKRLLETVRVSDDDIAKWHSKAGADAFEDYSSEHIEKAINYLKGKVK